MKQVVELMKMRSYQIPSFIFNNYKKLKMTEKELIVLIYMYNSQVYLNPKAISDDLGMKIENVLDIIDSLEEKNIIKIDAIDKDNLRCEMINYDSLYEKCAFLLDNKKDNNDIYSKYEKELGRPLSPMESEIISKWLEEYDEELIILALKEAIYNGTTNFRYIDRIIFEWHKKGIKTEKDIIENRKKYINDKKNVEIEDIDWLNE
ncbi:MAG: DnaD domain protein [Bacilli bacterium]|nr:DnaD domain protein [Bacilli bacterium]